MHAGIFGGVLVAYKRAHMACVGSGERGHSSDTIQTQDPVYCSAARCLLLTSRSSAIVSLIPLPFGRETHDFVPSPITKMLEILWEIACQQGFATVEVSKCVPRGERPLKRVLDVDDVEATNVLLTVRDDTATTPVATTGDEREVASIELDKVGDLALLDVETNSIVDLDQGVGVTDGAAVVGDNVRDTLVAEGDLADLEELVGSLLRRDAVDGETALDVVEETEVLARLLNRNDIYTQSHSVLRMTGLVSLVALTHEARGVGRVSPDLAVDLDQALHDNRRNLTASQSILEAVAEEDREGEGFTELVGTGGRAGGLDDAYGMLEDVTQGNREVYARKCR